MQLVRSLVGISSFSKKKFIHIQNRYSAVLVLCVDISNSTRLTCVLIRVDFSKLSR